MRHLGEGIWFVRVSGEGIYWGIWRGIWQGDVGEGIARGDVVKVWDARVSGEGI